MKVIVLAGSLLFVACGSDGSEFVRDSDVPHYVHYIGGLWKFEGGQRYWLKSMDTNGREVWEIG
jgi:hypothetical protein